MEDGFLQGDIIFNAKPDAIPYNYRISYKVSQLCLILRICGRGDTCSLIKLHMISFALVSRDNMSKLAAFADGEDRVPIVRFDPAVNRALTYAIAYGFIEQNKTGKYALTSYGKCLADQIKNANDLMTMEITDLSILEKKLSESKVKELVDMWRNKHAED